MADDCWFAGEATIVPQECVTCIDEAMDRIEAEERQLDDAVVTMRHDVDEMEKEMMKTDAELDDLDRKIEETRRTLCGGETTDLDAVMRKYDAMIEQLKSRTLV
jgi:predicted  nucleic acid-binding Zn-ribbon protein